jgi:hypothetical protein
VRERQFALCCLWSSTTPYLVGPDAPRSPDATRPAPARSVRSGESARVCALCAMCVRETVRGAVRAVGTRLSCRVCRGCAV